MATKRLVEHVEAVRAVGRGGQEVAFHVIPYADAV